MKLKYSKFDFRWAPPQTLLAELTAHLRPLAVFKWPVLLRGGRRKMRGRGWKGNGKARGGEGELGKKGWRGP